MTAKDSAPHILVAPLLRNKSRGLYELLQHLSKERFGAITQRSSILVKDHPNPGDFVYGSHLTVIQIASRELRITFKSHFTLSETQALTQKGSDARTLARVLESTQDLFMEYSNLVAGGLKKELHLRSIAAGISLPLATSGFDELIASDVVRPSTFLDYWIVCGKDFQFTCSVAVDFLDETWLLAFSFEEKEDKAAGSLEIL
ncbi:MAG: hypothetical protein H7249_10130 [Chitinophagaceae bacterium]|nr:hypothetical protein [Oligoflexus sp.]